MIPIYFSHGGNKALRQGKWKAVISSDIDGRWQQYSMEEDPVEVNNLADDFYNFENPEWKKVKKERLENMKVCWTEPGSLYRLLGKVGMEDSK